MGQRQLGAEFLTYDSGTYRLKGPAGPKWLTYRVESRTSYARRLPPCGPSWEEGSAIALVHFAERNRDQDSFEPDRVTFCEWFTYAMVDQWEGYGTANNKIWDTAESIIDTRAQLTRFQDGNEDVDWDERRDWRNRFMPQGKDLNDVDMSIGFDTFLTSVVGHNYLVFEDLGITLMAFAVLARTHFCRRLQGHGCLGRLRGERPAWRGTFI